MCLFLGGKALMPEKINQLISNRFAENIVDNNIELANDFHRLQLQHRSYRKFKNKPITEDILKLLFACALSAPSKSDLQQVSIIHLDSNESRDFIHAALPSMPWINTAPIFLLFCGDGHRIQSICEMHKTNFAHDPLDAFLNTASDTAMVLQNFILAAEALNLGCCPISAVREIAEELSEFCELPDCVYPLAGLCLGYPDDNPDVSARLPMSITLHKNTYNAKNLQKSIKDYDKRRQQKNPYKQQRQTVRYGTSSSYGWSTDKARQTSNTERLSFRHHIRKHGFKL